MSNRIDKIKALIASDTQEDEVMVEVTTPLGLWLGAFNCHVDTLPQLKAINQSKEGSVIFTGCYMLRETKGVNHV